MHPGVGGRGAIWDGPQSVTNVCFGSAPKDGIAGCGTQRRPKRKANPSRPKRNRVFRCSRLDPPPPCRRCGSFEKARHPVYATNGTPPSVPRVSRAPTLRRSTRSRRPPPASAAAGPETSAFGLFVPAGIGLIDLGGTSRATLSVGPSPRSTGPVDTVLRRLPPFAGDRLLRLRVVRDEVRPIGPIRRSGTKTFASLFPSFLHRSGRRAGLPVTGVPPLRSVGPRRAFRHTPRWRRPRCPSLGRHYRFVFPRRPSGPVFTRNPSTRKPLRARSCPIVHRPSRRDYCPGLPAFGCHPDPAGGTVVRSEPPIDLAAVT